LAEAILDVTDNTFEEIVPALEHITENYKEKLKVLKLNVDENMKTSAKFGVRSIPTLLLFKGGELMETIVGALPQNKIIDVISKHL
jgi:thioredoxin 1